MINEMRIEIKKVEWTHDSIRLRVEIFTSDTVVGRDEIIPYEKLQYESFFDYMWRKVGEELKENVKKYE